MPSTSKEQQAILTFSVGDKDDFGQIIHTAAFHENMSKPFEFVVDFSCEINEPLVPKGQTLSQTKVTFCLNVADQKRYFNGFISKLITGERAGGLFKGSAAKRQYARTTLHVRPGFYFTQFNQRYRIFANKTAINIVKAVLEPYKSFTVKFNLKRPQGDYLAREYCVQYGESDFNFVSRLLEEEGVFYYFTHEKGRHTMVVSDDPSGYDKSGKQIQYDLQRNPESSTTGIFSCQQVTEVGIDRYQAMDYDFMQPSVSMDKQAGALPSTNIMSSYPANFGRSNTKKSLASGQRIAKDHLEAHQVNTLALVGKSFVVSFLPGKVFDFKGVPVINASKKNVISQVSHYYNAENTIAYYNHFTSHSASICLRAHCVTPKPTVLGCQTAKVLTKGDAEIDRDKLGRIKVAFHWQASEKTEVAYTNACYIRVAEVLAGTKWGSVFTPRKGQEVVVSFLDGNPDRPLITGAVYNEENQPPVFSPKQAHNLNTNGIKTRSTLKGSPKEYNQLSFDDTKNAEAIDMHAQKDFNLVVNKGSQSITIEEKNRELVIKKGNHTITIDKGSQSINIKKGNYTLSLKNGALTIEAKTINVKATEGITMDGGTKTTIKGQQVTIEGKEIGIKASGPLSAKGMTTSVQGQTTALLKGGVETTVKSGAVVNVSGGAMVSIKGALTKIGG